MPRFTTADHAAFSVWLTRIAQALLFSLLFLALRGYNYGTNVHHDQVMPFILKLIDPTAFNSDAYVDSLAHYPSLFPQMMAAAARLPISLPLIFASCYAVMLVFLITGILQFTDALLESRMAAFLASTLILLSQFLNAQSFFGEDAIMRSYLEPTTCT